MFVYVFGAPFGISPIATTDGRCARHSCTQQQVRAILARPFACYAMAADAANAIGGRLRGACCCGCGAIASLRLDCNVTSASAGIWARERARSSEPPE